LLKLAFNPLQIFYGLRGGSQKTGSISGLSRRWRGQQRRAAENSGKTGIPESRGHDCR